MAGQVSKMIVFPAYFEELVVSSRASSDYMCSLSDSWDRLAFEHLNSPIDEENVADVDCHDNMYLLEFLL